MSPYTLAAVTAIVIIFVIGTTFNAIRLHSSYGSLPIVGTNDDNANHMALTTAAIKGKSLLFENKLVDKAISDGMIMPMTKWYPIGLYANTAHLYSVLKDLFGNPNKFNISLLFDLFAIYIPFQLIIFLLLFFQLIDGTYSARSIASFTLFFTFGFLVVLSEFFLKLYIYGFHAQLLGFIVILVLFIEAREISRRGSMTITETFLISTLLITIGYTYYLFIPIAILMYFLLHILLERRIHNYVPYAALVLGAVPLILFNLTQRLDLVNATYGVAFISFTALFFSLVGIVICAFMKEKRDIYMRTVCILVTGITIIQMIAGTVNFFNKTNNFGYYFFKSYWTIGFFGIPPLISFISKIIDDQQNKLHKKLITSALVLLVSGFAFFTVFSQDKADAKGYDLMLHVANGYVNYFPYKAQKRWIALSDKYGDTNGNNIYTLGKWGQFVLGHFVFGDSPYVVKKLFQGGHWNISEVTINEYSSSIIRDVYEHRSIHIIDNEEIVKKYLFIAPDIKTQEVLSVSGIFGD